MSGASIEELYSLLVPLSNERLIVPRACVAEVVRFSRPESPPTDTPEWLLGEFPWNGRELPLVSFEGLAGESIPAPSGRTRVIVFNAIGGVLRQRYFGMLTQGFPQLVRVNREVLRLEESETFTDEQPVVCKVRMINEYPLIPDLELIERRIGEATAL
ncbi:MAG: chemotaxis protein CheW [Pseudomonadota bacterium]